MMRMRTFLALAAILTPIAALIAGPDVPLISDVRELTPYAALKYTTDCQPGGRTITIAWGQRSTAIGLYVYGADGQCIGSDDAHGERLDERIVGFTPVESGPYEMVVRSFSARNNPVQMSFRSSGRSE